MKCNFDMLWRYLTGALDLDARLQVLEHVRQCEICFEAIYQMSCDRDSAFFHWPAAKDKLAS